jgi:hypothetical protein
LQEPSDYWAISSGVTQQEAAAVAGAEGFGFEIGRISRFENARNAVVIAGDDLKDGLVNRIELAEEIQHGVDRESHAASRALARGLSSAEFHAEVFARIIERRSAGGYQFLTQDDVDAIQVLVHRLKQS